MALQTKTYSQGSLAYGSDSKSYVLDLILTEESTSLADNTSEVAYKLQLRSGPHNRFTAYIDCAVELNGTTASKTDVGISAAYNCTYVLMEGSVTVKHNNDGTFSLPFSASIDAPSTNKYAPPDLAVSGSMKLTAIDRESTVSASDANIGGASTVVVSRKSDSFTHTLAYRFGNLSGYLKADGSLSDTAVKLTATTVSFPLPDSFYAQIPDDPSGECTLTVTTYSGNTQIGTAKSCSFTATAAESKCAPTVSGTVVDVNEATLALTGDEKTLVRYMSTAQCTMSAAARCSAELTQRKIGGVAVTGDSRTVENVQTGDIPFWVQDSRGYSGTHTPTDLKLVEYVRLACNASVKRTDPTSGNAELIISTSGYFNGSFGAAENTLTLTCTAGGQTIPLTPVLDGNTYTASAALTGLDYQSAHTVTVCAEDRLERVTKTLQLGKGIPVFDWGEDDFNFNCQVKVKNKSLLDLIYPVGSIYMSVNAVSPADFFGGTWERIEDRFLLAAGSSYPAGSTGGEAAHKLTVAEMPSHNHGENLRAYGYSGWNAYTTTGYSVIFPITDTAQYKGEGFETTAATVSATVNTNNTGGSTAHNNLPPYLSVYMWKRTG